MNNVNIAVIGAGNWGKNIIRVCYELNILAAISDDNVTNSTKFSSEYGVALLSWEQILNDPNINAVAIALPAVLHAKYVEEALQANKHVFVEKPLAMDAAAAEDLCLLAKKQKRILMIGHILQYHNAYIKLQELVAKGEIGQIKYIESTRLHMGPIRYDAGIIWELLPHDVSMLLGVCNLPVNHLTVNQQQIYPTQSAQPFDGDVIDINLRFNNGVLARVYSSWLHPRKEQKFWVAGTSGMLVFEDTENWDSKLKLYKYNSSKHHNEALVSEMKINLTVLEPLKAEISHFMQAIIKNKKPKTHGLEGLAVVKLLQQIELAASRAEVTESTV